MARTRRSKSAAGAAAGDTQPEVVPVAEAPRAAAGPRGRRSRGAAEVPAVLAEDLVVRRIPLGEIDLSDTTYRFRAVVRVSDLVRSIRESGQQIPAVVRPHPQPGAGFRWQLVSGFRRAAALKELRGTHLAAYVRRDLTDDQEAFRASVLENVARKTYSDIDRAYVIKRYQDAGYQSFEVADLMNLTRRQKNNLLSLLDLPEAVQVGIAEEGTTFKATHALMLRKLHSRYPELDYEEWLGRINEGELSISQIVRAVNEAFREQREKKGVPSVLRSDGTNLAAGEVRLRPVKFKVGELSPEERASIRQELESVLALLG